MTIDVLSHDHVASLVCGPLKGRKNKGRSPNVLRYIESCGNKEDINNLLSSNLAAGARLAKEDESQSHDKRTSRSCELWVMSLEQFAEKNGDDAMLFGPNKRPFLAATIQTYMRKFVFNFSYLSLSLLYLVR